MHTGQKRFWPKAVSIELRRLPWRLLGTFLIAWAAALLLALLSWSFADPAPDHATDSHPRNWLGYRGAGAAQTLMEGFGLAAPLIVLPLAALGLHIAAGYSPLRLRRRFLFWAPALLAAPGFFSSFSTPPGWLLGTGFGGIFGDFVAGRIAKLSPVIPPLLLWPASALFFLVLGAWCVWRACGLTEQDLALAFETRPNGQDRGQLLQEIFAGPSGGPPFANRLTSWVKRLSPRNRAVVQVEGPREFWMAAGKNATAAEKPAFEGASPFSNWGGGFPAAGLAGRRAAKKAPAAENTARPEAAKFSATETKTAGESTGENGYDDSRIEPFFGPRPGSPSGSAGGGHRPARNPPSSPFLRLTGHATKVASAGAQRILVYLAQGVKARAPLIFIKNELAASVLHPKVQECPASPTVALPPLSLLAPTTSRPRNKETLDPALMDRAASLIGVLEDFGVKGRISGINPGPVITLFELDPARGTKSSRVAGLADDIARSMNAPSARISAIPGRDTLSIELPNPERETVSLRALLGAPAFQNSPAPLPLALGKSLGGEPVTADLARMPHLLIAGAAEGSGLARIGNVMLPLLFRLPPSQCKFIVTGPEVPELSAYDGLPHLLAPVITDPKKAVTALRWAVNEMNSRYERMENLGVSNIASYNSCVAAAQLKREPLRRTVHSGYHPVTGKPFAEEETLDPVPMPYLVIVTGELASLMMCAGEDVEFAMQRLSQMARGAGIHLVAATQQPCAGVVTDKIKASFPSRICFQVSTKIESRVILGEQGAEQLLGGGDMLYLASGARIIRLQGASVLDREVEAVVRYWKAQGFPCHGSDSLEDWSRERAKKPERRHPMSGQAAHDAA
jgi:S-DNA-T family DNA segregation ATPase FtsK/SpoIIIE